MYFTTLDKLHLVEIGTGSLGIGFIQFLKVPQLRQEMTFASKVVKSDSTFTFAN
jgi:hypothetical protein